MKLQYYGHSCFSLRLEDGTTLVLDPFDKTIPYPVCTAQCDAALITHDHFDHNNVKSLRGDFRVLREVGSYEVGSAKITAIPSFHDDVGGAKRGSNLIFRIDAEGISIAHCGDLGHMPNNEQLAALRGLDLLLIPVGGYYTIDTPQAEEVISLIAPRCAVAMHYKVLKTDPNRISTAQRFIEDTGAVRMPNIIELNSETVKALPSAIVMDYKA